MIRTKSTMMRECQKDIYEKQTKINTLQNEKHELTALNMSLASEFSNLEVFASIVLGKGVLKNMQDTNNNYDIDLMVDKYQQIQGEYEALKENYDTILDNLKSVTVAMDNYNLLKKKIDSWGGDKTITQTFNKVKTLSKEIESKNQIISQLNQTISSLSEDKGGELLQIMKNVDEDIDTKSKHNYQQEISLKSQEILELKERIQRQADEIAELSKSIKNNELGVSVKSEIAKGVEKDIQARKCSINNEVGLNLHSNKYKI